MNCPDNYLCALSGVIMTTPVILTATNRSFELSVLSKALRSRPLTDPLTGNQISSNAMEIDFDLQAEIENYLIPQNDLGVDFEMHQSCSQTPTLTSLTTSIAPPVDFALALLSDSDEDTASPRRDLAPLPTPGLDVRSIEAVATSSAENVVTVSGSNERASENDIRMQSLCENSQEGVAALEVAVSFDHPLPPRPAHALSDDDDESLGGSPAQVSLRDSLEVGCHSSHLSTCFEHVSFRGPPATWTYSRGSADIMCDLLKRDNNEYCGRNLLSNLSSSSKRARALSRRMPTMWGFQTENKSSPQAIVSIMNTMYDYDDHSAAEEEVGRVGSGPLGAGAGQLSRQRGGNSPRNSSSSSDSSRGSSVGTVESDLSRLRREGGGGNTALHVAVWNGHLKVVVCLVEAGANLETKNANQCTPLMLGCRFGHVEIVKYLLLHGAAYRAILKSDICKQGKTEDAETKAGIQAALNFHRKKAGLSYLR